jgi:hypothetical protein
MHMSRQVSSCTDKHYGPKKGGGTEGGEVLELRHFVLDWPACLFVFGFTKVGFKRTRVYNISA